MFFFLNVIINEMVIYIYKKKSVRLSHLIRLKKYTSLFKSYTRLIDYIRKQIFVIEAGIFVLFN